MFITGLKLQVWTANLLLLSSALIDPEQQSLCQLRLLLGVVLMKIIYPVCLIGYSIIRFKTNYKQKIGKSTN
jgi:hypothetical protein